MTKSNLGLRWEFRQELSRAESMIMRRLTRTGRLFAFLRKHRHELFDEAFQAELAKMYSDTPRGTPPKPPALLAMVTLLQAYERKSDAGAVEEAVFDRRWQMVLDCMGAEEPPFSQGVLVDFRHRMIKHNMDKRLVERTVELARETKDFGHVGLRVALDSSPLWGAGRVEDTFNLLGHALEIVVDCTAKVLAMQPKDVLIEAKMTLLGGSSLKAALDIDWDDKGQQQEALGRLLNEIQQLRAWIAQKIPDHAITPPLQEALTLLGRIIEQDLEPTPDGTGSRIKRGVARDRVVSVSDPDMRHGRKSKSKLFNGYKRHIARELDCGLILAATVRPANEPEHAAADVLRSEIEDYGPVAELHIDRGYLASGWTHDRFESGQRILAKPWTSKNGGLFPKTAFTIHLDDAMVRCPENNTAPIRSGRAQFDSRDCGACTSRDRCTRSKNGHGRTVTIHPDERLLIQLRTLKSSPDGRTQLRERVALEHALAHVSRRQGPKARYLGVRKNVFDIRRVCAVENLNTLDRFERCA